MQDDPWSVRDVFATHVRNLEVDPSVDQSRLQAMAHFSQFFLNILEKLTKYTGGQLFNILFDLGAPGLRSRICIQERQIDAAHDAEKPHADALHAHLFSQLAQLRRCKTIILQLLLCQAQVVTVSRSSKSLPSMG